MMNLNRSDFSKQMVDTTRFYYSCVLVNHGDQSILEIGIEPCAGGFCVALYDLKNLSQEIGDKICTDDPDKIYTWDIYGTHPRSDFVWAKAIGYANRFVEQYRLQKPDHNESAVAAYLRAGLG